MADKVHRERFRALGMCLSCGAQRPEKGYTCCPSCREVNRRNSVACYQRNKDRLKGEQAQYYRENKDARCAYASAYCKRNASIFRQRYAIRRETGDKRYVAAVARTRKYYKEHKESHLQAGNARFNARRREDLNFKIRTDLRARLWHALRGNKKAASTLTLLGCSVEELKTHIAAKFQVGMTWETHGYRTWHIDHIVPCSKFNLADPEEQRKCFHYTNLQPLWATDNMKKGNRVPLPI